MSSFYVFLLVVSFLIKSSFYPMHSWLPYAHGLCGTGGSVFLAGIFLKLGGYGIIRMFDFLVYVDFVIFFQYIFICFSFFGMLVSSIGCILQIDIKKLIAFSSVSHMNFSVLILFLGGVLPCVIVWVSHGFITSLLFFMFGWVYSFFGSRLVWFYGNLWFLKRWWFI